MSTSYNGTSYNGTSIYSLNINTFESNMNILFFNLFQLNEARYDVFYNPVPMNITLQQMDDFGNESDITLPNIAMIEQELSQIVNNYFNDYYTKQQSNALFLELTGGTMTGPLYLSENPVEPMEAVTKEYVDLAINTVDNTLNNLQTELTNDYNQLQSEINANKIYITNTSTYLQDEINNLNTTMQECCTELQNEINALNCSGTCSWTCSGACKDTCTGGCTGSCTGGCYTSCTGTCAGGCTSCTGSCTSGCTSCTGTCSTATSGSCGEAIFVTFSGSSEISNAYNYSNNSVVVTTSLPLMAVAGTGNTTEGVFVSGGGSSAIFTYSGNTVTTGTSLTNPKYDTAAAGNASMGLFTVEQTWFDSSGNGFQYTNLYTYAPNTVTTSTLIPWYGGYFEAVSTTSQVFLTGAEVSGNTPSFKGYDTVIFNLSSQTTSTGTTMTDGNSNGGMGRNNAAAGNNSVGLFCYEAAVGNDTYIYTFSNNSVIIGTSLTQLFSSGTAAGNSTEVVIAYTSYTPSFLTSIYNLTNNSVATGTTLTSNTLATGVSSDPGWN